MWECFYFTFLIKLLIWLLFENYNFFKFFFLYLLVSQTKFHRQYKFWGPLSNIWAVAFEYETWIHTYVKISGFVPSVFFFLYILFWDFWIYCIVCWEVSYAFSSNSFVSVRRCQVTVSRSNWLRFPVLFWLSCSHVFCVQLCFPYLLMSSLLQLGFQVSSTSPNHSPVYILCP